MSTYVVTVDYRELHLIHGDMQEVRKYLLERFQKEHDLEIDFEKDNVGVSYDALGNQTIITVVK